MRHGLAYIFDFSPVASRFDELVAHIERAGMSLAHRPTGKVLRVSPVGEAIVTTQEEIRERLVKRKKTPFNFYIDSDSTNVFCSITDIDDTCCREEYDLSGKTEQESLAVIDWLTELFVARAKEGNAFAFVVDEYAEMHADFIWDDFVLGKRSEPPEWRLRLGFSKQFLVTRTLPFEKYEREDG